MKVEINANFVWDLVDAANDNVGYFSKLAAEETHEGIGKFWTRQANRWSEIEAQLRESVE